MDGGDGVGVLADDVGALVDGTGAVVGGEVGSGDKEDGEGVTVGAANVGAGVIGGFVREEGGDWVVGAGAVVAGASVDGVTVVGVFVSTGIVVGDADGVGAAEVGFGALVPGALVDTGGFGAVVAAGSGFGEYVGWGARGAFVDGLKVAGGAVAGAWPHGQNGYTAFFAGAFAIGARVAGAGVALKLHRECQKFHQFTE